MNHNHNHQHVASVPRAAAFYERYFGMHAHVWHGDMVFMRDNAGMDLALAPNERREPFPEWFHIGFRLGGHAAVQALHERIVADGMPVRAACARDGDYSCFRCTDPDGYQIEVYYEPDPA